MSRSLVLALLVAAPISLWAQARELPDFADLAERQGPAVVNISTTSTVRGQPGLPPGPRRIPSSTSSAASVHRSRASTNRARWGRAFSSLPTAIC